MLQVQQSWQTGPNFWGMVGNPGPQFKQAVEEAGHDSQGPRISTRRKEGPVEVGLRTRSSSHGPCFVQGLLKDPSPPT
jgi:hypothetical protein